MDFSKLTWPKMGSSSSARASGWNTTEIRDGKPVTKSLLKKKKKKKSKEKKDIHPKSRSEQELIEFYKKDRRFISVPLKEEEEEKKQSSKVDHEQCIVRVMTYNILGDGKRYALGMWHKYCPIVYRYWKYRFPLILSQLKAYDPDIVCIQEATPSSWKKKMKKPLNDIGYTGIHAVRDNHDAQHSGLAHSEVIIWKQHKYRLIKHKILRFSIFTDPEVQNTHTYDTCYDDLLGQDCSMFRSFLRGCQDVAVILHLQCNQTKKEFIVLSTHFHWFVVHDIFCIFFFS